MEEACKNNDLVTVNQLINDGYLYLSDGMGYAAEYGHKNLVEFFIEKGADRWEYGMDYGMHRAARGGQAILVEFFIEKGANNWNCGMSGAVEGGHKELVEFFIEKGANNWNRGMYGAALGGHKSLVEFFIEKGANDWNNGMYYSALYNHKSLVEFFIEKGANNFDECLKIAKNKEIYLLLIDNGAKIDETAKWIAEREVKRALGREIIEKRVGIGGEAKYLLDEFF